MGMIIDGNWTTEDRTMRNGAFLRAGSNFERRFKLEPTATSPTSPRYWLIASSSCPWSHGATIVRAFHELYDQVGLHIAHGPRIEGYAINGGAPWSVPGTSECINHLHQLYTLSDGKFTGQSSVPVLWDAQNATILSDDSRRILQALNDLGRLCGNAPLDLAPDELRPEIDAFNDWLYSGLNNAVYQAGFAETQAAYDAAVANVFATLDQLEALLSEQRYLLGSAITEPDWRLFPTLVRFDGIYSTLHRCSRKRLTDYPALWSYARDLYAWPGISETVDFIEMLKGSYLNDTANNPNKIVPVLPEADWDSPHGRHQIGSAEVHCITGEKVPVDDVVRGINLLPPKL